MRYELDNEGYVLATYWGCHSGNYAEYTGEVPTGYSSLVEWSENALINAYYINEEGNLTLDSERQKELKLKIEIETEENTPILRKDFIVTNETVEKQYVSATANGSLLVLDNVKKLDPYVKITDIECYKDGKIEIYAQTKNMLKNDGKTETINGVTFTRYNDSIAINGKATANIEYDLSGSSDNATSLFMLRKGTNYYLNIGGFNCEMKYFDGETTAQVYIGASGLINLTENKKVTQVILKIPVGTTVNTTIKPQLELGSSSSEFVHCETNRLTIDLSEYTFKGLFPSDDLFPSDTLYPMGSYILIQSGAIYVCADNKLYYHGRGNVRLFNGYNLLYTLQGANLDINYFIDELVIERKVDNEDFTGANIMLAINNDTSSAVINADKISLNGKEINLTSEDISITSDNFNVDSEGNIVVGGDESSPAFKSINEYGESAIVTPTRFSLRNSSGIVGWLATDSDGTASLQMPKNGHANFYGDGGGTSIDSTGITTPVVTQTSLEESKKNFEKLENGLEIIKNTDIYKYNLKSQEDTDKKHIGFVIGDNYNYSQEITSQNNDGVDTYSMISVAYKAIQELAEENRELKARIEALEKGEK